MHIVDMIFYWARTVPHRAAVIQMDMVTTYQAFADAIESIGEHIDRLNLDKREPVAVCLANPSFMLATVFALLRCGYSAAPVNARLYPVLADAGMRTMIYDAGEELAIGVRNIRFDMSWLPGSAGAVTTRAYHKRPIRNASLIFFTSGTTGAPKKVVRSAAASEERLRYCMDSSEVYQRVFIMPGLTSSYGLNRAYEVFNSGKTACFAPDGVAALSLINLYDVEVVLASTLQALALADMKNKNPGFRTDSLKAVFIGGGSIGPDGIARIRAALCRNVINTYGATEAGAVGRTPLDVLADEPGAIAFPWVELQIVDDTGAQLPAATEGTVRYRTPQLIENIKAVGPHEIPGVRDGWFYPGDLGSVDDEGVFHLAGRSSDVLNRGGVKVSGARIEEILAEMPEIREAAACGVFGSSGLEEIWIGIVANGSIDIERIKIRLREHKEIGIAPDEIILLDQLPRGELGKVEKSRLKEQLIELRRGG